jgi:hypothetical protein
MSPLTLQGSPTLEFGGVERTAPPLAIPRYLEQEYW